MVQKDVFLYMESTICRLCKNDLARYSEWIEKRLLSFRMDLDGEYEREFDKRANEASSRYARPEDYEPADVHEYANGMAVAHCLGIAEVTGYMIGMAIAGLYHLWEKQVVRHLGHEMRRYDYNGQLKVPSNWKEIKRVFKAHSTDLEDKLQHIYPVLNELRLVTNVMKHGYGSSYNRLEEMEADILYEPDEEIVDEVYADHDVLALGGDHALLKVEIYPRPEHFRIYCLAVEDFWDERFWEDVGEKRFFNGDGL